MSASAPQDPRNPDSPAQAAASTPTASVPADDDASARPGTDDRAVEAALAASKSSDTGPPTTETQEVAPPVAESAGAAASTGVLAGESSTGENVTTAAGPGARDSVDGSDGPQTLGARLLELPELAPMGAGAFADSGVGLLGDVELNVKVELGRAEMRIGEVLRLGEGSVVELDKLAGDPVEVLVNERLVARGEVLILNDNYCVRISEIVAAAEEEQAA